MLEFKNREGETLSVEMTLEQLAEKFALVAGVGHWAWYHLAKCVKDSEGIGERRNMIAFLADSFLYAIGQGLKRPMIRLQVENRRYKIYLSKRGTICVKAGAVIPGTSDPDGDEEYVGCLYQGRFLLNKERKILPEEQAVLDGLSADPVAFMAKNSKDMDRCCYCNLPLEDKRSKEVGYGSTCAGRWGLPWGKSYDEKVPSFAQIWARTGSAERFNVRMMCQAIRQNPEETELWGILGNALEDAGFPKRPTAPARGVVLPAADPVDQTPAKETPKVAPVKAMLPDDEDERLHGSDTVRAMAVDVAEKPVKVSVPGTVVKVLLTSDFTWNGKIKTLSAEASGLGIFSAEPPKCLNVRNPKSGNTARFTQCGIDKDNEGEVIGWRYYDRATDCYLVILND